MPYYDTLFPNTVIETTHVNAAANGTINSNTTRNLVLLDERDRSYRSRPSKRGVSTLVPDREAEPYSWFTSVQDLYRKNALDSGFDARVFHEDTGHPWTFERRRIDGELWTMSWQNQYNRLSWVNGLVNLTAANTPTNFLVPASGLESWAALQYGRMAPVVSEFSFSAFTGELREGLPKLLPRTLKSSIKDLKGIGDDYLNVQFGWEPLLNDLRNLAQSLLEASYGLYRPFGAIRRNRRNAPIVNRGEVVASNVLPYNKAGNDNPSARVTADLTYRTYQSVERWIEGEFVYVPKAGFDPSKYMDRLETLMSLDITPSVLWQLTPWSWLVDWFTEIGGALQSAEAATNPRILSTFCYAMEETQTVVRVFLRNIKAQGGYVYTGPRSLNTNWHYTRKRRIRANPFGYTGSPSQTLSSDKMAILAALGLSRSRL